MSKTNAVNGKYYYKKSLISRIVCHSVAILSLLLFFLAPCFTVTLAQNNELFHLEFSFSYVNEIGKIKSLLFADNSGVIDTIGAARYAIAHKTAWLTLILFCLFALALVEQIIHLISNILSLTRLDTYVFRRNSLLQKDSKKLSALKRFPSMFLFRWVVILSALHWLMMYVLSPLRSEDTTSSISYFLLNHKPNFLFWLVLVLAVLATVIPYFISIKSNKKGALSLLEENAEEAEEPEEQTATTEAEPEKPAPVTEKAEEAEEHEPAPVTVLDNDEDEEEEEEYTVSYLDEDEEKDSNLHSDAMPDDLNGYGKN